jgi:hypothetical protein
MKKTLRGAIVAAIFLATGSLCAAATPYASATVEGAVAPGVYGRIEIGNAPPPPVIYTQPIIIQRPTVVVQQQPVYMHVPPGHAKNWSKHCRRYDACGYPVYFVKVDGDEGPGQGKYKYKEKDKHHGKSHGNKHDD